MNKEKIFTKIYLVYPSGDIRADLNVYERVFLTWLDESPLASLSYTQEVFHSMIPLVNEQSFRTFQRMLKKLKEMGIIKVTVENNLSNLEIITLDKNKLNSQIGTTTVSRQQCRYSETCKPLCINA